MAIEVLTSPLIESLLNESELRGLIKDFRDFKSGELIESFGKDVPYNHMNTLPSVKAEEIWHIHLLNINKFWPRYVRQENKTSDDHLVYCFGCKNVQSYLLITILQPNAHKQAFDNDLMLKLARVAENFRNKY